MKDIYFEWTQHAYHIIKGLVFCTSWIFLFFLLKPFYILRYVHISYITFVDSGESVNALFTSKNLEEGECEKDKNVLNCKMLKILQ